MRRKTFDTLLATGGLIIAGLLVVAGALLTWAYTFIDDQVTEQLTAQQIYFPEEGSESLNDPAVKPYIEQYAGQQVTTGEQARAYADHYIQVHVDQMTGGKTYSQVSEESRANPDDEELAGMVQTVFRGQALRGLLLNAYAFWQMGQIAMWAAIASFAGAALMGVLGVLGLVHARRVPADEQVLAGSKHSAKGVATA